MNTGSNKNEYGQAAAASLSDEQVARIESQYSDLDTRNNALLEEVKFILSDRIENQAIKIHSIDGRIKELQSVISKCKRDGIDNLEHLSDLVGARVVCLFRSDLNQIESLIKENFEVVSIDNKLEAAENPLGYMSIHYRSKLPSSYRGPRYEKTKDAEFEIQVRTLCMHCWAAVSHYLDYKGEWDVPLELKRSLNALGGLFYVADSEFEQFYAARLESKIQAERCGVNQEINFDTLSAYIKRKFPDREDVNPSSISSLVHEAKTAGYQFIDQIDLDVNKFSKTFNAYEKKHGPSGGTGSGRFFGVGAVRICLKMASPKMRENTELNNPGAKALHKQISEFQNVDE